jgi:pseudaminic acid biosynthesis-associated methylase
MSGDYNTPQEALWAGEFGESYIARNSGLSSEPATLALFSRILGRTVGVQSVLELGCNVGLNLRALKLLLPSAYLQGVEINARAARQARVVKGADVWTGSILAYDPASPADLVFTMGVLIHISPPHLNAAYDVMYRASRNYLLVIEYYSPAPVEVPYRGRDGLLFKRDFAGDLMNRFPDLQLVDYGFVYRRDPVYPLDDLSWFLMRKP